MLEAVRKMRELVKKNLWYCQVAALTVGDNGDINAADILCIAALSVTDEATALEIGMNLDDDVVATAVDKAIVYENSQDFVLELIDQLIAKLAKVN